jgi:uncharacterized protein involved in exopolysaccharide biosynthesis
MSTESPGSSYNPFEERLALMRDARGNGTGVHHEQTLRDLVRGMARRRWTLLGVALTVFLAVTVWAFTATPRYRASSRVRIQPKNNSPTSMITDQLSSSVPGASLLGLDKDDIDTEVGILRSERVSDAAIDSLALGVRVKQPAASRAAVLSARVVDPAIDVDGKLTLTRNAGGRYRVEKSDLDDVVVPAEMIPGAPIRIGGFMITLAPTLATGGPDKIVVQLLPRYKVYKLLAKRLVIAQQEGGSKLIEVMFDDPDRMLAVQVVNVLVNAYLSYTTNTEETDDTTAVVTLRAQVDSTARRLAAAEQALRSYEERSKLIVPDEQAAAQIKRLAAISEEVDKISVERSALARMLTLIEERAKGSAGPAAYRQLVTFPTLITNKAIQDMLAVLVDLENKRSLLSVRRTESNDEYRNLTTRISEIERQLYVVGPQYLESLDQSLKTTSIAVQAITDTLGAMPEAAMQYGRFLRDRTILDATYLALIKQLKQAELRDVLRTQRVRIVDTPRPANPDDPSFPKKPVMLTLGAVLGLAVALMLGLAIELWREPTTTTVVVDATRNDPVRV